ncbi:MAG: ABC transporter ATP-binding protein [Eubacteriales bacterium]|nr:ABC transporter ATP-binding protein [Eubacteriales bacterium]
MSDIRICNISYSYTPSEKALRGVSFCIPAGCFCGIIGPNGSGKTTLLKCISGYFTPDEGQVLIDGKDVACFSTREIAKRMALVQQHASLEYDFTVMDIVLTGRNPHIKRMRSETEADYAIAHNALECAGIHELKDRLLTTLSGGEWQMMILARALCQQADIMLLDEPVAGLDIAHQVGIMSTVRRLAAERGISVVCVLHDLNLARAFCQQIVLLKKGMRYAEGTPDSVLTKSNIEHVYGTKVNIIEQDGQKYILPVIAG